MYNLQDLLEKSYEEKAASWSEDLSELENALHKALWGSDVDEKRDSLHDIIRFLNEMSEELR